MKYKHEKFAINKCFWIQSQLFRDASNFAAVLNQVYDETL